jgi:hypothetical protein
MTAPNYPNSPTIGQIFQVGTTTFEWDGVKWRSKVSSDPTLRAELAAVDSGVLIAGVPASVLAQMSGGGEAANIKAFGATGNIDQDATPFYDLAIASGKTSIYFPKGQYRLNYARIPSNITIFGDGYESEIYPLNPDVRCAIGCESADITPETQVRNVFMSKLRFVGDVVASGFSEQKHLVSINGVKNFVIQDCWFDGFRGDGVYVGTGDVSSIARHNNNVYIDRCIFDGLNKDNRNGVSVIDGTDVHITNSYFTRCTRSNMPGPIDFEPNSSSTTYIIRNISVQNCAFFDNGGGTGAVAVFLPNLIFDDQPSGITFKNLSIDTSRFAGVFFSYTTAAANLETLDRLNMVVENVTVRNCEFPLLFWNSKGVTITNFNAQDCTNTAILGFNTADQRVDDFKIIHSSFTRCGSVSGNGLSIYNGNGITFQDVTYEDCGRGESGAANAMIFQPGITNDVAMIECKFRSPTGKTQIAVQISNDHVSSNGINREYGNVLNGLPSRFPATAGTEGGDYLLTGREDFPYMVWYKRFGDAFTELPYPDNVQALPGKVNAISMYPSGLRVAFAHENEDSVPPYVSIYDIVGGTLKRVTTSFPSITAPATCIHVSSNSQYMAVGMSAAPWLRVFKINSDDTFTDLGTPASTDAVAHKFVKFNRTVTRLAAGSIVGRSWSRAGDTFAHVNLGFQALSKAATGGGEWFKDGELVIVSSGTGAVGSVDRFRSDMTPYNTVSDDPDHPSITMVPAPNPSDFPAANVNALTCSVSSSNILAIGLANSPYLQIAKKAGTKLIKITEPTEGIWLDDIIGGECHDPQINASVLSLKWSGDSKKIAIVNLNGTKVYDFSGTSFGLVKTLNTEPGSAVEWWPRIDDI